MKQKMTTNNLLQKANELKLHGLIAHWDEVEKTSWIKDVIDWEESERLKRGLEHRLRSASIGKFTPLANFDWGWPTECDREAIEELMKLEFIKEAANVVFCGGSGAGKSTIARNLLYQAVMNGYSGLFITASKLLTHLTSADATNLSRRINYYVKPSLLCIDEVGYLSYSNRHADLLFEIIARRYEEKSTIITTNKPFSEWGAMFPNASCVVSLIDRLVHRAEIISIQVDKSFRLKESEERKLKRQEARSKNKLLSGIKNKGSKR
jgi:DNA replication protein DnaC